MLESEKTGEVTEIETDGDITTVTTVITETEADAESESKEEDKEPLPQKIGRWTIILIEIAQFVGPLLKKFLKRKKK